MFFIFKLWIYPWDFYRVSRRPDHNAAEHDVVTSQPAAQVPTSERIEYPVIPRKILLIDDSLSILKVVSRLLKLNGHTVDTASNGLLGLEKLKKTFDTEDYDMVLTDLQMPIMDGIEATDRYRKFESEENLKKPTPGAKLENKKRLLIVGMSANSDEQSKKDALETGMDYFFTKPFAYKDLQPILLHHQEQHLQFSTI
jgi:CheY-like chemotaxis protein